MAQAVEGDDKAAPAKTRDVSEIPATSVIGSSTDTSVRDIGAEEKNATALETDTVDPLLVTWDGENDPQNPRNWPRWRKWAVTLLTSLGGMVTLMSSTMMAPALPTVSQQLGMNESATQLTLSIFVLSFAFGPMVLAPMTEVFGRRPVFLLSGCFYIVWSIVCGFSNNFGVLVAGRFFAGLGGSAEFAVSNPVLSDVWRPEQRGHSFAIATFLPLLGPALGPILGGVLTGSIGWRWIFWVLASFDALLMITGFFLFSETYAAVLLDCKAKGLRKVTGQAYYTEHEKEHSSLAHEIATSLARPTRLLLTQPFIQLMSVFMAYNFGILYIAHSTFATLWIERYNQSVTVSGLHYIALVTGLTIASQVGGPLMDRVYAHLKTRAGGQTAPEYRIPLMLPGAVLIPAGLFWYGWTAENRAVWILPDIGIAIFACGLLSAGQAMQAYVMDAFPRHVASATAASQLPRGIAAFAFPSFAPAMFATLGYGWGNSVLAFISIAISVPAPILLWRYGARLRAKGAAYR